MEIRFEWWEGQKEDPQLPLEECECEECTRLRKALRNPKILKFDSYEYDVESVTVFDVQDRLGIKIPNNAKKIRIVLTDKADLNHTRLTKFLGEVLRKACVYDIDRTNLLLELSQINQLPYFYIEYEEE